MKIKSSFETIFLVCIGFAIAVYFYPDPRNLDLIDYPIIFILFFITGFASSLW